MRIITSLINYRLYLCTVASAETPRCQNGRGQSGAHQGVGHQQAEGPGGAEPAPARAEPQVQPAAGAAQAAHGPAERGQDGRQRLCRHVVAAHQHVIPAQGQQHRIHAVSDATLRYLSTRGS